jgi:hypothetical protein
MIRERCSCNAEFEVADKYNEIDLRNEWREAHYCLARINMEAQAQFQREWSSAQQSVAATVSQIPRQ